jgi:hypothetical protein
MMTGVTLTSSAQDVIVMMTTTMTENKRSKKRIRIKDVDNRINTLWKKRLKIQPLFILR